MKKSLMLLVLVLLAHFITSAQSLRTESMGGMTLGLRDRETSLNLYDFGKNPAWLLRDEIQSWLDVAPRVSESSGEYRKMYDPGIVGLYQMGFEGVQAIGEKGTFRGYATYGYEQHRDVYRALKRFPYQGDAFFMTDTTTGNITFKGPLVNFMYAYEPFNDFIVGASASYQLLDGLKDRYSRIKTVYRNIEATFALAYQASPEFGIGLTFTPASNQEGIEAKSDELYEVEIFNFRGETYAFRQRGSSVDHKVRTNCATTSLQAIWSPDPSMTLGVRGDYGVDRTHVLVTRGSEKEVEEGSASLEHYSLEARAQCHPDEDLLLGVSVSYRKNREWSRYTTVDLLLWDWKIHDLEVSAGGSYYLVPGKFLVGAEYHFSSGNDDSSKYIDNRFRSEKVTVNTIRTGIEIQLFDQASLRLGYSGRFSSFDVISGGRDVAFHGITGGGTIWFTKDVQLDMLIEHGKSSPKNSGISRSLLNAGATLRLWSR